MKKAQIWVSAILYLAMGVIILTIILATSLPVIKQLKDKNTVVQTKNLMSDLDQNIRAVYSEGPGSRRPLKLTIGSGNFIIDSNNDEIKWTFESSYIESEPNIGEFQEGKLYISTQSTGVEDVYLITLRLDYSPDNNPLLDLDSSLSQISGTYDILVSNLGESETLEGKPKIQISEI